MVTPSDCIQKFRLLALASLLVLAILPAGVAHGETAPSSGRTLNLVMSKFQFCRQAPCQWPAEAAYTRNRAGPVDGTDNHTKFVAVAPGDTITWTYEDSVAAGGGQSCDFYGTPPVPEDPMVACFGHAVTLEDGTPEGENLGFLPARSGRVTMTWTVPADTEPGSLIRYYCNVTDFPAVPGGVPHWIYGMTGGLKVVPVITVGASAVVV